jgi:hypothetical protein
MLSATLILCGCSAGLGLNWDATAPIADKPELGAPPTWMTTGCPKLAPLGNKQLSQAEVLSRWGTDSEAYHNCRSKYYALRKFYKERDEALRGVKQ